MSRVEEDEARESRIEMEVVVDAYGEEERAMGWYYYLEGRIRFPFKARCIVERRTSPLAVGDEVRVQGMAPEDECDQEMFVEVKWSGRKLDVPLFQLEALQADPETQEAIDDWHYWVSRGYGF